jgi:hypothetical protein
MTIHPIGGERNGTQSERMASPFGFPPALAARNVPDARQHEEFPPTQKEPA